MARKFDLISELYERTCFAVTDNPVNWQSFLKTAGRNFRLRFDEQLLIYAQRPDATAVLEIERWNGTFGRWVNRGAKGIAVFEDADRSRQRLIHYFDISDTHESRHSRPVPIWEMRPDYEAEVIETLENTFGAVNDTTSIENVVKESIANAVEDNIADYISDFMSLGAGSDIEYLSADEANALYLELVRNSVSYMVMARLGLNADKVYSPDDFAGISSFNSQEVLNAVGIATSDIAEMALLPVSRTISTLSKENRIIDEQGQSEYNKDIKDERSQSDERNHIHDGGRLQSSEPEAAGAEGSDSRQMVADEENLSEGTSQNSVLQSSDERDSEQSLGGGSAESQRTGGNSRKADGRESGTDGADESGRYDEMGSPDEQHQELGTGNREESGNIRLEYYDRNHEDKSLPFFGGDDTIREILGTTPHLSASKEEIKDFYERNTDNATRKYWTIVPKGYKKPIRLKNLGEDYTEEAIKRRLTENQGVRLMPFTNQTVVIRQYRLPTREHKIKKVGGLYGLYLYYCYKLGYLPKYKKQNTARLHYLLKEDLLKLDKITQETRLLGRENISTDEQLFSYKESVLSQIENLTDDRTHLRKQLRKNMSDDELSKVKEQIKTITDKLWTLRKEVGLCDDIAERSKFIEANIETVRAYEEKQERKEQNRNDKFR